MKIQYIHGSLCLNAENQKEATQIDRMVKHSKSGLLWLNGIGGNTEFEGFSSLVIRPMENIIGTKAANILKEIINHPPKKV